LVPAAPRAEAGSERELGLRRPITATVPAVDRYEHEHEHDSRIGRGRGNGKGKGGGFAGDGIDVPSDAAREALWFSRHQSANLTSTGSYGTMEGKEEHSRSKETIQRTRSAMSASGRRSLRRYASSGESGMSSGGESRPDTRVRTGGRGGGGGRGRGERGLVHDGGEELEAEPEFDGEYEDSEGGMTPGTGGRGGGQVKTDSRPPPSSSLEGNSVYRRRWAGDDI